jgi:hypothetical protein
MDEQAIREQISVRFRRREIFLAHFLLWAIPGLIIGGVIMPPPDVSQMLRVVFQSWAFLVAAHAGVLLYLEYREYAIRHEIDRVQGFAPKPKRKRAPQHELELDQENVWLEADESAKRRSYEE